MTDKHAENCKTNIRSENGVLLLGKKDRDLTQSYDKSPYTHKNFKRQWDNTKRHQKLRLHHDCGPAKDS